MIAPHCSDRPLRVLVVTHYYAPHIGGIENVARREALGLAGQGMSVTVLSSGRRGEAPVDPGVRVSSVPALNILERFGIPFPLFRPLKLVRAAYGAVRRADVVHVHDTLYMTSWIVSLWCRILHIPLLVTQHVAYIDHPWRVVPMIQRLVFRTVGRGTWRRAIAVCYQNGRIRDTVASFGVPEERLVPLPNGVDLEQFAPVQSLEEKVAIRRRHGLPVDRQLVLFVGRLVQKKGYRHLVDAAEAQDEWSAVLVGAGSSVITSERTIHLGALDAKDVTDLYRACDLFVLPSTGEGFPLTMQEAMASGLPVVTTDDVGYGLYGMDHHRVMLLPPGAPGLGGCVADLLADPHRLLTMANYSRDFACANFDWDRHVATVKALLGHTDRTQFAPGPAAEVVRR